MNRNSQKLIQRGLLFLFIILLLLFSWNKESFGKGLTERVASSLLTLKVALLPEEFAMEPIPSIDLLPTPPIIINQSMFKPIKYGSITIPPMIK